MKNSRSLLVLFLPLVAAILVGCTRPPELIGINNPEISAASVPGLVKHRIFITTTREQSTIAGALYSADRSSILNLASVDVTVPPTHVVGQLERPKRLPPDPRTEFSAVNPLIYQTDAAFISGINRQLAAFPRSQRNLLVFIHGYNNTASDALLRLAQFVEDTDFKGVAILFTWASAAKKPGYVYDLNSALAARVQLKEMSNLLSQTNAKSVDVLGHSMGAFLTMEGLVDAQLAGRLNKQNSVNHIILAAPDIDIDLFRTQINLLPDAIRKKMYIFISDDDKALKLSRIISGGVPRVGSFDAEELESLGVTVIDLSKIEDSSSGSHSKFAGSPEVVQLIGAGLQSASSFDNNSRPGVFDIVKDGTIRIFQN